MYERRGARMTGKRNRLAHFGKFEGTASDRITSPRFPLQNCALLLNKEGSSFRQGSCDMKFESAPHAPRAS
ncbi:hypothetical protein L5D93_03380 [Paenibacillus thiaminolyticus]|nr:hypothetical protein [Paenibacillus thiaminolyticus]